MKTAHASNRELAAALKANAQKTGETSPSVRGADWRTAVVTAVGAGTVTADGIVCRCQETYFNPAVGDVAVISQSSNGNWRAEGRLATVSTTPWTTAVLATGFTHDGNSNGNVQYRSTVVGGTRFMEWRGGLGITYASNSIQNGGDCLAVVLPAELRPASLRSLVGPCSASSSSALCLKIDARLDGQLRIVGTTTSTSDTYANPIIRPPWVSLNGLRYSLD
ncbi:hypothetical protein [Streptomyces sp. KL116D]|uniref:hypothetical protein n=1 Tax=Streptomyces sp. KL116D TaxID=3045152 RepID=UPI0035592271